MNINSHKIGPKITTSSRTPQMAINGIKKGAINNSIFKSNRKSPILNNIKKAGVGKRNRPPLYKEEVDTNSSSLPVIVNSLSNSHKNSSDSYSPELLKRYELKGRIMKPRQRLVHIRHNSKVGLFFINFHRMRQKAIQVC